MSYRYPSGDEPATIFGFTGWWRVYLSGDDLPELPPEWEGTRSGNTYFFDDLSDDPLNETPGETPEALIDDNPESEGDMSGFLMLGGFGPTPGDFEDEE